jgi:hypothetical protein
MLCFLFCDFGNVWKDGNPMGVVWRGGAYIACSAERNRYKLHIISEPTPPFSTTKIFFPPSILLEISSRASWLYDLFVCLLVGSYRPVSCSSLLDPDLRYGTSDYEHHSTLPEHTQ